MILINSIIDIVLIINNEYNSIILLINNNITHYNYSLQL